jgi:hypothetical protein
VVVTKNLPGERWLQILTAAGCRVEVRQSTKFVVDSMFQSNAAAADPHSNRLPQILTAAGCRVEVRQSTE